MSANPGRASRFRFGCWCDTPDAPGLDRRNLLAGGAAALGLGAIGTMCDSENGRAQTPAGLTRIDVHHHFIPPFHVESMMARGARAPSWTRRGTEG